MGREMIANKHINYKAICVFCATGFFLDEDTYYIDDHFPIKKYAWHYTPRKISFDRAVEEFAILFEQISKEQLRDKKVILPLSGGLDSRTQAAALKGRENVFTYSYQFDHSFKETKYGQAIAQKMKWPFKAYTIPCGYLWKDIETLANWNGCYTEFTAPRQMAIANEFPGMGEIFYLGHWGDVLFDNMGVPSNLSFDLQVEVVLKKIVKKSGWELADAMWKEWNLEGNFKEYLTERVRNLLLAIPIENANARIRAFKSLYWLSRWTMVNLCVFEHYHPIALPYCDERMWDFVCTVPEDYLAGRKIQIEYIKRKAPELAEIPWQPYSPCNLYNYKNYDSIPIQTRVLTTKFLRRVNEIISGRRCVERNWELQLLGLNNFQHMKRHLRVNDYKLLNISPALVDGFLTSFLSGGYINRIFYSHSVSVLLTLKEFENLILYEQCKRNCMQ